MVKSPFEKGGFRGISRGYIKSPLEVLPNPLPSQGGGVSQIFVKIISGDNSTSPITQSDSVFPWGAGRRPQESMTPSRPFQ